MSDYETKLRDDIAKGIIIGDFVHCSDGPLDIEDGESEDDAMKRHWAFRAETAYLIADAMLKARGDA